VAQVGRRLAENLIRIDADACADVGIDADVVEAACLAHDLGHPPFGHLGEQVLNELVSTEDTDGFQGNAQSFRIITKTCARFETCRGLDLTRAVLAASMKYPWKRELKDKIRGEKWGYYSTEEDDFQFVFDKTDSPVRSIEATIMDFADDIAYSVHDIEDFHRASAIPWNLVFSDPELERIVTDVCKQNNSVDHGKAKEFAGQLREMFLLTIPDILVLPYEGLLEQRLNLRTITSRLIARYMDAPFFTKVGGATRFEIDENMRIEILLLKQVTRDYIISSPSLGAQQRGYRRIIVELYADIHNAIRDEQYTVIPKRFWYLVRDGVSVARRTADCICSMTEAEAIALHARLRGLDAGSVLDPIVR
jgi:dGTPase